MAKRRHNKSALIREELAQNPDATAAEVVKALSAKRVNVSAAHVYNVKATRGKRRRTKGSNGDGLAALIQAKKLVDSVGSVEKAKAALNALAKLL